MEEKEFDILSNAIKKYERLSADLEINMNRTLVKKIVTDASILKYSCEFGLWYYNHSEDYKHLKTFQDIDQPYQSLFKNYYELLELLSVKISVLKKFIPFFKSKSLLNKEDLSLKLKLVHKNCSALVYKLKLFQKEIFQIEAQVNSAKGIANESKVLTDIIEVINQNQLINVDTKILKKVNIQKFDDLKVESKTNEILSILNNLNQVDLDIEDTYTTKSEILKSELFDIDESVNSLSFEELKLESENRIDLLEKVHVNKIVFPITQVEIEKKLESETENTLVDFLRQTRTMKS